MTRFGQLSVLILALLFGQCFCYGHQVMCRRFANTTIIPSLWGISTPCSSSESVPSTIVLSSTESMRTALSTTVKSTSTWDAYISAHASNSTSTSRSTTRAYAHSYSMNLSSTRLSTTTLHTNYTKTFTSVTTLYTNSTTTKSPIPVITPPPCCVLQAPTHVGLNFWYTKPITVVVANVTSSFVLYDGEPTSWIDVHTDHFSDATSVYGSWSTGGPILPGVPSTLIPEWARQGHGLTIFKNFGKTLQAEKSLIITSPTPFYKFDSMINIQTGFLQGATCTQLSRGHNPIYTKDSGSTLEKDALSFAYNGNISQWLNPSYVNNGLNNVSLDLDLPLLLAQHSAYLSQYPMLASCRFGSTGLGAPTILVPAVEVTCTHTSGVEVSPVSANSYVESVIVPLLQQSTITASLLSTPMTNSQPGTTSNPSEIATSATALPGLSPSSSSAVVVASTAASASTQTPESLIVPSPSSTTQALESVTPGSTQTLVPPASTQGSSTTFLQGVSPILQPEQTPSDSPFASSNTPGVPTSLLSMPQSSTTLGDVTPGSGVVTSSQTTVSQQAGITQGPAIGTATSPLTSSQSDSPPPDGAEGTLQLGTTTQDSIAPPQNPSSTSVSNVIGSFILAMIGGSGASLQTQFSTEEVISGGPTSTPVSLSFSTINSGNAGPTGSQTQQPQTSGVYTTTVNGMAFRISNVAISPTTVQLNPTNAIIIPTALPTSNDSGQAQQLQSVLASIVASIASVSLRAASGTVTGVSDISSIPPITAFVDRPALSSQSAQGQSLAVSLRQGSIGTDLPASQSTTSISSAGESQNLNSQSAVSTALATVTISGTFQTMITTGVVQIPVQTGNSSQTNPGAAIVSIFTGDANGLIDRVAGSGSNTMLISLCLFISWIGMF